MPANYPSVPPILEIEANQSGSFTYRDADNLFDLLMEESLKRVGEMMVFDLVTIAQEHMAGEGRWEGTGGGGGKERVTGRRKESQEGQGGLRGSEFGDERPRAYSNFQ